MGNKLGNTDPPNRTLEELLRWLEQAPDGTHVEARIIAYVLAGALDRDHGSQEGAGPEWTWAELLWVVPAERRLGTREVLEALGRGKTWLYTQMSEDRGRDRLPHRKLDGQVLFTAGEVRAWIRDHEEVIVGGRLDSTLKEKKGLLRAG